MDIFSVTLNNVLLTLLFLLPGILLQKAGRIDPAHQSSLGNLLLYGCAPCMFVSSLIAMDRTPETTRNMGLFALISFLAMLLFMGLLFLIFRKKREDFRVKMLLMASVMGNVGFFGLPIVKAIFPENPEAAAYSCVFCATMNLLAWTVATFFLTGDKKYISLKAATVNPTVISVAAGFALYLLEAKKWLPGTVSGALSTVSAMTTPMSMIVLGVRLATMNLKELFGQPHVYGIALSKQVIFPLFAWGLTLLLPLDPVFRASILILSAAPCASIILILGEIFDNGQKLAADCVLLSTLLCFITLPLLTLLL